MKELIPWRRLFATFDHDRARTAAEAESQPQANALEAPPRFARRQVAPSIHKNASHLDGAMEAPSEDSLPPQILAVEVEAESETELSVTMKNGERQGAAANDQTELFVRVLAEAPSIHKNASHLKRTGFTYTQDLDEDPISVIRRAYESSQYAQTEEPMTCEENTFNDRNASHLDGAIEKPKCEEVSVLWQKAEQIDRWLAAHIPEMTTRHLTLTSRVRELGIVNTEGCDRDQSYGMISVSLLGIFTEHGSLEKEWTFPAVLEIPESLFNRDIEKWKRTCLPESACLSGTYQAILDGNVMTNILLTSWQMFSALKYQNRGTPYAGKLGEQIGKDVLQIQDRVSIENSGFRFDLDCQGSIGKNLDIVRGGKLTGLMQNLTTSAAMHTEPTGNAGRKTLLGGNIHTETLVTPKNFGILPGNASFDDLLRELRDGLYIFESFDVFHSINIASGEFSIPCNAIVVENGRMTGRVDGVTMTGKVQELFASVTLVGEDTEILPMIMLNSYTVFSPSVLVSEVYISE